MTGAGGGTKVQSCAARPRAGERGRRRAARGAAPYRAAMTAPTALALDQYRLTRYAHGGGCACKIPPGELEERRSRARALSRRVRAAWRARRGPRRRRRRGRRGDPRGHAGRDGRLLHPRRRRPVRLGPDRRGQRAVRRLRHGRHPRGRRQPARLAARGAARSIWPGRCCAAAWTSRRRRLSRRRRPQRRRAGADVRHERHRRRGRRPPAPQRRRGARAAPHADQAARRRRPQQPAQGDGREVPAGDRQHGGAERPGPGRRPRRRRPLRDRRHGVRAARATCTSWPGPAASPPRSTPPPSPTWTAPARRWPPGT